MALQQAQLLLNMSSLEPVNFGVQQNNTEAFAVALCHLAELHAEQVTHFWFDLARLLSAPLLHIHKWFGPAPQEGNKHRLGLLSSSSRVKHLTLCPVSVWPLLQGLYSAVSEILLHLKEQFPPHSQHAKVCSLNHDVSFRAEQRRQRASLQKHWSSRKQEVKVCGLDV